MYVVRSARPAAPSVRFQIAGLGLIVGAAISCGDPPIVGPAPAVVAVVAVSPGADTLTSLTQTLQLTASAADSGGATIARKTFTWSSSDPDIAEVDAASGQVTSRENGEVTITATVDGISGQAAITVAQEPARLAFTVEPSNAPERITPMPPPTLELLDVAGAPIVNWEDSVTLAIGTNPGGGYLFGSTRLVPRAGLAQFHGVAIEGPGSGYTLVATSGAFTVTSAPFDVTPNIAFALLAAGGSTCGLMAAGAVYCWGNRPALVPLGGLSFDTISAGFSHWCALTGSGAAYCWGDNFLGKLGDGTETSRALPVPVAAPAGVVFTSISSGWDHTCALTDGGALHCWGRNDGRLGDGTRTRRLTPVLVSSPAGVSFTAVTAAAVHTCALATTGVVYCFGNNGLGQLGDGTMVERLTPVAVAGSVTDFVSVSAGGVVQLMSHTCALRSNGMAYCWGSNRGGQVGDGASIPPGGGLTYYLVPTPVIGGFAFTNVRAGSDHTCGLLSDGNVVCWGENGRGQLGDGVVAARGTPMTVLLPVGVRFASITAGFRRTCGLTVSGGAYCWGTGVGDGSSTNNRTTPVPVWPPQ